ncbi:MAG: endonuclease [Zetaproteobacteria bacterium]|nr:endonuclease [Zetaproteobacteria bacterium]
MMLGMGFLVVGACVYAIYVLYFASERPRTQEKNVLQQQLTVLEFVTNPQDYSFATAKKRAQWVYSEAAQTFYCGCPFEAQTVDAQACGVGAVSPHSRKSRVEWEHLVAASTFGRKMGAWVKGHPSCVNRKGVAYRGRRCVRKVSKMFNRMESDLYNLVPALAQVNRSRSNLPLTVPRNTLAAAPVQSFGACQTFIYGDYVVPREEVRGWVARASLYMHHTYPAFQLLEDPLYQLYLEWFLQYPPSDLEKKIAARIFRVQGNLNPLVTYYDDLLNRVYPQPISRLAGSSLSLR